MSTLHDIGPCHLSASYTPPDSPLLQSHVAGLLVTNESCHRRKSRYTLQHGVLVVSTHSLSAICGCGVSHASVGVVLVVELEWG